MKTQEIEQKLAGLIESTDAIIAKMKMTHRDAIAIGDDPSFLDQLPKRKRSKFKSDPKGYRLYKKLCDYRDWLAKQELATEIAKLQSKTKAFQDLNQRLTGIVKDAEKLESTRSGSLVNLFNKLEQRGKEFIESVGSTFAGADRGEQRTAPRESVERPPRSGGVRADAGDDPALAGLDPLDAAAVEVATPAIVAPGPASSKHLSKTRTPSVTPGGKAGSKGTLEVVRGELTALGEGSDAQTKFIHWPNTASSGVTLGKGYDIGSRSATQVIEELTAAGMTKTKAKKIANGAGLKGERANAFVKQSKNDIGEISLDVQRRLLASMLQVYSDQAQSIATSTTPTKKNTNARGREIKGNKPQGTYRMTTTQWDTLHPAMIEFLTDLKYQGGYYLYDRVARINSILIANEGNHLDQFKGVATLFEAQREGVKSYMDAYALKIQERGGNKETFYGQNGSALAKASTRRNRLRLAFLKQIIAALEAGKTVKMSTNK